MPGQRVPKDRAGLRTRRHIRVRAKVKGTLERPRLVVANKMDEPSAEANLKTFKRKVRKTPVLPISAAFDQGILLFRNAIREAVEETGKKLIH